jgi:Leucine-rich repeat (LRR) protein
LDECNLFFSTYTSTEYQEEQATDDASHNASDHDFEWNYIDYWMTDKGICMWYGVTCPPLLHGGVKETSYNGNNDVLHLHLTDNGIRGTIPPEIAALENLITLDLGRNNLEGTIPVSITSMADLGK